MTGGLPDPESKEKYEEYFQRYVSLDTIPDNDMRGYYLANLNCMDDNIGRLLDTLEKHSLSENTLVILFSDNGGSPITAACNLPLAGSKFTLSEGGIRVPLIASWPGKMPTGKTNDRPVSTLDILPTCLQAAGIATPDTLDGESFAMPVEEDVSPEQSERTMFWKWMDSYAVRDGDWKLLYKGGKDARRAHKQIIVRDELLEETCLFNLCEDPAENRDLSKKHPEIVRRLQETYDAWSKGIVGSHAKETASELDFIHLGGFWPFWASKGLIHRVGTTISRKGSSPSNRGESMIWQKRGPLAQSGLIGQINQEAPDGPTDRILPQLGLSRKRTSRQRKHRRAQSQGTPLQVPRMWQDIHRNKRHRLLPLADS